MFDVTGKVAVVTGSATGIGRATALMLARLGCGVVINYTQSEVEAQQTADEARSLGVPVLVHRCDISSDAGVREMMKRTVDELGRLDVLICNAGTAVRVLTRSAAAATPPVASPGCAVPRLPGPAPPG